VVFRADAGAGDPRARPPVVGAEAVARQVLARGSRLAHLARPALVNGAEGAMVASGGKVIAVVGFTIVGGRIAALDLVLDREKRPSVLSATESPRPSPMIAAVTWSISGIPGPPAGPS